MNAAPRAAKSGTLISTPADGGPVVVSDTVSCVHCAFTWQFIPGSGRRRGWCMKCHGIVCGRPACVALGCVHREQLLDNIEAGRALDFVPVVGRVEFEPPRG